MVEQIVEIARQAGDAILDFYSEEITVEVKSDDSPLTKADLASHRIIADSLKALTPDIPLISEEGGIAGFEEREAWDRFWLVDPLDGTKEFIKKNGEFTVNIALIESGIPVLGVVYIPAADQTYTGQAGRGSFRIDGNGVPKKIWSAATDLNQPLTVITSRSHGTDNLEERLEEIGVKVGKTIPAGSSLKFCLVAEGAADLYPRFGPTMEWDTAAGDAVFRYSGREAARYSPLIYNKKSLKNDSFVIGLK